MFWSFENYFGKVKSTLPFLEGVTPIKLCVCTKNMTTGLAGLPVAKHPHHTLGVLYNKILRCLKKMPSDAAYRTYTEKIITERHNVIKAETNVVKIEEKINCGQIEELILQADYELQLARKMLEWKPWEPLMQEPLPNQWKWPL